MVGGCWSSVDGLWNACGVLWSEVNCKLETDNRKLIGWRSLEFWTLRTSRRVTIVYSAPELLTQATLSRCARSEKKAEAV